MILTPEEAFLRVAERTAENTRSISRSLRQRRNQVVDMYGVEFTRQGDANSPARFYISITPDLVYLERFEFKLIVHPFLSTVGGGTGAATVAVDETSLSVSGSTITPNPHKHTTQSHTHTIVSGVTPVQVTATDFRVKIENIDVTPYLMAQYGGNWITGEGVFPSLDIGKDYDILEVASDLVGEGRNADADKLVSSGYKAIEISANGPFGVTLVLYLKMSHMNR